MQDTAPDLLRGPAARTPSAVALVERDAGGRREHTWEQLAARVAIAAAALRAHGIAAGDRIALAAANGEPVVVAWFAIVSAGAVVVPISTASAPAEIALRLDHAGCRAILHDAANRDLARAAIDRAAIDGVRPATAAIDLDGLRTGDTSAFAPPALDPAAPAMILYTSGTTGRARGAVVSHRALVAHTRILVEQVLHLGADARILGVLPLAHSYGCRMVMLAAVVAGGRAILLPRFDAASSLAAMIEEEATWAPAVPTMLAAWGALPDGPRPRRLAWCLSAGAPLADGVARRAETRLGAPVRQAYGMTEATISTLNAPPDERVLGSVGRPAPGVEVRIADGDDRPLPAGVPGQVLLRGHNLMTGYLDDPAATADALRGGWMHTGDIGRIDPEGRLFVVDRLKDMIIRGGNNVYPSEVEEALASHPAVREVAVVGRPDERLGEEIVAIVVPADGAAPSPRELRDWAADRIAGIKVPREYVLLDALPLGPSRKVLKRELREGLAAGRLAPARVEPPPRRRA